MTEDDTRGGAKIGAHGFAPAEIRPRQNKHDLETFEGPAAATGGEEEKERNGILDSVRRVLLKLITG
jgi:hypothetical protein